LFQDHSGSAVMTKALRTSFTEQHGLAKYIACKYIICLLIYLFTCTLIFSFILLLFSYSILIVHSLICSVLSFIDSNSFVHVLIQ